MVVGSDLDGYQDVLGMGIGAHESAQCWLTVLTELNSRGVQDILVVAVDNRTGFSAAMATVCPRADVQQCIVHQIRNSLKYAARKDYAALPAAWRPIYLAPTEAAGAAALADFADDWGARYPTVVRSWPANWHELATFYRYPEGLRRTIYTTNLIEGFHRQLRQVTTGKRLFPPDAALTTMLFLAGQDAQRNGTKRLPNWGTILGQLASYFEDRLTPYLK
jgi:putative transposase